MSISTIIMILAIIWFVIIPSFKARTIPVRKLALTPAIFMYMLYRTVTHTFYLGTTAKWCLALGLSAGIIIGVLLRLRTSVTADKQREMISLSGTWINLITFILIFCAHYAVGYLKAVNPEVLQQTGLATSMLLFVLTCASSISLGASACLYYKYMRAKAVMPAKNGMISNPHI
jgi:hypothetical protein